MINIEYNKVYNEDCLIGMQSLINNGYEKCFDFVEIDPPYNIGKDEWDKFKSHEEYLYFIKRVLLLSNALMSDNGTLFVWHNDIEVLSDFIYILKNSTNLKLKQQCLWNKYFKYNNDGTENNQYGFLNGFIQSDLNRNYQKMCEYVLYYTKQDTTGLTTIMLDTNNFNTLRQYFKGLQRALGLNKKQIIEKIGQRADHCFRWGSSQWNLPTKEAYDDIYKLELQDKTFTRREYEDLRREYEDLRREYEDLRREYEDLRYTFNANKNNIRSCVWNYQISKETKHKTEKPLQLYYDMLEVHTRQNSKCLFPFVGSGNNIVSLLELNNNDNGDRSYIGFETDKDWHEVTNERILKFSGKKAICH